MKSYLSGLIVGTGSLVAAAALLGQDTKSPAAAPQKLSGAAGGIYNPVSRQAATFRPVNVRAAADADALERSVAEVEQSDVWLPRPDIHHNVPINREVFQKDHTPLNPTPSTTGVSPGPRRTFKAEYLSGISIPPDTMGAVGVTHVVVPTNNMMRILDRYGIELMRVSLNSFWASTTIKGTAVSSAFDPKILFDRFNSRFIFVCSLNGPGPNSGMGLAVSATADPTGLWYRYTVDADDGATGGSGGSGHAIDYPSLGHNHNWIAVMENTFNYSCSTTDPFPCSFTDYFGPQIFVFDKQAAYSNTLSSVSLFEQPVTDCTGGSTTLGCGFTMVPTINEENTSDTIYLVEEWDSAAAQLRLSKLTGTASTPELTVGIQFPQSADSWRFSAQRIGTSGGYAPQRQQMTYLPSTDRIMTNDARIQNAVLRNGKLWTTHTVMLGAGNTPAGTGFGSFNPDVRSAVQWWEIDPTNESAASTVPLQRGRIEDPVADNCHDGTGGTRTTGTCTSTAEQKGLFFAFPNISVNKNNDVLIGFAQFSPFTYPNGAYAIRRPTDPANTTRDPIVFRPGQANYNLGSGSSGTTSRQNRWGDYTAAQTDPVDDVAFWTVQEYAGTVRDFGFGLNGNWETWFARIVPTDPSPAKDKNLLINEFRLRGPQGPRDEFVELYNPTDSAVVVETSDGSDGWALATSDGATTIALAVVPWGTVIPARGHFLIADNPDAADDPTTVYSLNGYAGKSDPASLIRGADSDTGFSVDIPDGNGLAMFKSSTTSNFTGSFESDAAGPSSLPAGSIFKKGMGYGSLPSSDIEYSMLRDTSLTGLPQNTNNNRTDFLFVDTAATFTAAGQALGAPGPENLDAPVRLATPVNLASRRLDTGAVLAAVPNRQRDFADTGSNKTFGTLAFRRTFTNNSALTLVGLRFRLTDATAAPVPSGVADLRLLSASDEPSVPVSGGGTVSVQGVTLQQPATQLVGGGFNSSGRAAITPASALTSGASVNVRLLFGVAQKGSYHVCIEAETAPATGSNVVCYDGNTEPLPQIVAMSVFPGAPSVTFTTTNGDKYAVERSDNLLTPGWTTVTNAGNISGTGNPITVNDPDPGAGNLPKRFYHVVIQP